MSLHQCKVEVYGKDSSGSYETTPLVITDLISAGLVFNRGASADSFSMSILNDSTNSLMESINIDDRVKIYGRLDSSAIASSDLVYDGLVNAKSNSKTTDNNSVIISGLNRLEKLFNALVSTTGETGVTHTSSYWIANIIRQVNDFNSLGGTNRQILYVYNGLDQDGNSTGDANTIAETNTPISFVRGFEKAFKLIEELCKPDFTGGYNYVHRMDENNKFHYLKRTDTLSDTLEFGVDINSQRTQKGMFDIVNYIILNAGKSLYDMTILQFDYRVESINKFGWKVKLLNESLASVFENELRNVDQLTWTEDSRFPVGNYPFDTGPLGVFEEISNTTINNDSELNSAFVDEILASAKKHINKLLDVQAGASYKINLNTLPSLNYALNNKHKLKLPSNSSSTDYNWSAGVNMRIASVNIKFSTKGWITDLKLAQDKEDSEGGGI